MGWVTMSARLLYIQLELNSIEWEIDQIARQKMSLHKYGSTIADGKISMMELAGMPLDCWGMGWQYVMNATPEAQQKAMGRAGLVHMMQFGCDMNTPYKWMFYQAALDEALKTTKKAEEERIKVIEEELDFRMKKLEQRQKVLDKEYESVEKRIDKDIDRTTPKYA